MSAAADPRRRWLHRLGAALSALALAWIVWRFARDLGREPVLARLLDAALLWRVLAASLLYAFGLGLLVLAWQRLLVALAGRALPLATVGSGYATSQFGKYLPGNVAHYVLRHARLRKLDLAHALLLAAGMLEALGLVLAAATWSLLLLGGEAWHALRAALAAADGPWRWLLPLAVLLAAGLLGTAAWWWWRSPASLRQRLRALRAAIPPPRALLPVLGLHLIFFAVMASCLWLLAGALPSAPPWPRLAGAATASWLGGFLVPGAPGGLGVREVLLVGLLHGTMPAGNALLLAAAFRVTTFSGDVLLFAVGALGWRHTR